MGFGQNIVGCQAKIARRAQGATCCMDQESEFEAEFHPRAQATKLRRRTTGQVVDVVHAPRNRQLP